MSHRSAAVCTYERIVLTITDTLPDRANGYYSTSPFPFRPTAAVAQTSINFPQPQPILPLLLYLGIEAKHADRISRAYANSVDHLKTKLEMCSQRALAHLEHNEVLLGKFLKARARVYSRALYSWAVKFLASLSRSVFSGNSTGRLPKTIPPPNKYQGVNGLRLKDAKRAIDREPCTPSAVSPGAASNELADMMHAMSLGLPASSCRRIQPSKPHLSSCHITYSRLPSSSPNTIVNTPLRTIPNRELQETAFLQYAAVPARLGDTASLPQTRRRRKIAALPKRHNSPPSPFMQPHSPPSPEVVIQPLTTRGSQSIASVPSFKNAFVTSTAQSGEDAPLGTTLQSYDRPRKTSPLPLRRTTRSTEFRGLPPAQSISQLQPSPRAVQAENLYLRRLASRTPSLTSLSSDEDSSPSSPSSAGPPTPTSTISDLPVVSAPSKYLPICFASESKNVGSEIPWSLGPEFRDLTPPPRVQFSFSFASP